MILVDYLVEFYWGYELYLGRQGPRRNRNIYSRSETYLNIFRLVTNGDFGHAGQINQSKIDDGIGVDFEVNRLVRDALK